MTNQQGRMTTVDEIQSLEEVPEAAKLAERQLFLNKWYKPVAIAPFVIVLFTTLKFFPDSTNRAFVWLTMASLIWAGGVAVYAFYLLFWFKCPRCHYGFGLRPNCKSCDLPRFRTMPTDSDLTTLRLLDKE